MSEYHMTGPEILAALDSIQPDHPDNALLMLKIVAHSRQHRTATPASTNLIDTDTALRTADVLWSALRDRLEPEEHIGYGRLYEQMYSWMLDRAQDRP